MEKHKEILAWYLEPASDNKIMIVELFECIYVFIAMFSDIFGISLLMRQRLQPANQPFVVRINVHFSCQRRPVHHKVFQILSWRSQQ